jgi:hypothetical protein
MIIFHGTRYYGKVDHVPGLFHVATLFFHVQFIPLIPLGSYLVLEGRKQNGGLPAIEMRWSARSVLLAWIRVAIIGAGLTSLVLLMISFLEWSEGKNVPRERLAAGLVLGAGSSLLLWVSYRLTRAKATRALRLAAETGIPPEVVAQFFASRLTDEELEQLTQLAQNYEEPMQEKALTPQPTAGHDEIS